MGGMVKRRGSIRTERLVNRGVNKGHRNKKRRNVMDDKKKRPTVRAEEANKKNQGGAAIRRGRMGREKIRRGLKGVVRKN